MSLDLDDTIAALCSSPGPAARGIIRVGGPRVRDALADVFIPDDPHCYATAKNARSHPGRFRISGVSTSVPVALYDWPDERSYTGGRQAELHTVGSPPLLDAMLAELHASGVRPARPGEFTLRAFLAGRIDLVEAEAVLGVIDANSHIELETALGQLAGGLSGPISQIRDDLLSLLADIEAELDFVEEDIQFVAPRRILERLRAAREFLERLLEQAATRMQTTARSRVVLAGLPNAGKSTLFNALVGSNAALVSPTRGTTRDYLFAVLDWGGTAIELVDTAGWDVAVDGPAGAAQQLRGQQLERADLVVWCTAADVDASDSASDAALRHELSREEYPLLCITTKADCLPKRSKATPAVGELAVCATTGEHLREMTEAVASKLGKEQAGNRQMLGSTASRCRDSLAGALRSLTSAHSTLASGDGYEILAIDLRAAVDSLGEILGHVYTDDILDRIFSKFCIGK